MTSRDLLFKSLIAVLVLAPLASLTVIAWRSHRRGAWLAAPWLAMGLIWLTLFQLFERVYPDERASQSNLVATGFLSGWLAMTLCLLALTIVGPRLPPPGLARHN